MRQISKEFIRDVQRVIGYDYIVGLIGLATQTVAGLMSAADKVIVDNLPTTYAPIVHTHDDRYYTETETDTLLSAKLDTASYTAADVLAKVLTIDGAGSGLDADLLDGFSSAAFQPIDADLTAIAALADPNADRILFWDDSLGAYTYLVPNTGISISGTNLNVAVSDATTQGIVELATTAEATTGTDTTRAVTPAGLQASLDAQAVQFDSDQSLTAAQQGQARDNIGFITGDRSPIINGNFDIWQRGTSQTVSGYGSDDRWVNSFIGGSLTHSRQTFTLGQTDVPGNPKYFSRTVVTHAVGAGNFHLKYQGIEGVQTLAGGKATITIYAKADAARPIAIELQQSFGSGGAPSASVTMLVAKPTLTTSLAEYTYVVDVPSISGKTLGTSGTDMLILVIWFEAGSDFNSRTGTLGQQSGTFDVAHISIVPGDATAEADPFPIRPIGQELVLCQRYYEKSFNQATAPAQNAGTSGSAAFICQAGGTLWDQTVRFAVPKRTASYTLTTYSPNAASANWSTNGDTPTASIVYKGDSGFGVRATTPATTGNGYSINWTADAEL